jgi:hypothetical protein
VRNDFLMYLVLRVQVDALGQLEICHFHSLFR